MLNAIKFYYLTKIKSDVWGDIIKVIKYVNKINLNGNKITGKYKIVI